MNKLLFMHGRGNNEATISLMNWIGGWDVMEVGGEGTSEINNHNDLSYANLKTTNIGDLKRYKRAQRITIQGMR